VADEVDFSDRKLPFPGLGMLDMLDSVEQKFGGCDGN
jgi:hypothetical protein